MVGEKNAVVLRKIVLTGLLSATLTGGKFVLSAIPNVEIVTLLLALYGYVFGGVGVLAAFLFCAIEPLLYGFGIWWVLPYFIHWPCIALVFSLLGKRGVKGVAVPTAAAVVQTLCFGVETTAAQLIFAAGTPSSPFGAFFALYAAGISFYAVETVTNAVFFAVLFQPLSRALARAGARLGIKENRRPPV